MTQIESMYDGKRILSRLIFTVEEHQ